MRTDRTDASARFDYVTIYVAFELSKSKWQIGIVPPGAQTLSRYRIDVGDMATLSGALSRVRAKVERMGKPVRVLSPRGRAIAG
ncbi:hypothetical protein J2R76_003816 [Bradyrhizobium sp. USDA 4532]|uniref:hypothetical protein n=1 Tax=unclassified Bradyrhizobium TaxID=2631580 RepID=UPI00209EA844|nr:MULTISPECIES: hypothetical protein [unclassified Bradyrhizobium]MCP1835479.1 hypothetical protein [Bradyrhizobium sp. USDA 4545]MCP1920225.1 hypothetical protein [Bradyrhizobium sp. USDA 4532]